jgi:hypothetical protein
LLLTLGAVKKLWKLGDVPIIYNLLCIYIYITM